MKKKSKTKMKQNKTRDMHAIIFNEIRRMENQPCCQTCFYQHYCG